MPGQTVLQSSDSEQSFREWGSAWTHFEQSQEEIAAAVAKHHTAKSTAKNGKKRKRNASNEVEHLQQGELQGQRCALRERGDTP